MQNAKCKRCAATARVLKRGFLHPSRSDRDLAFGIWHLVSVLQLHDRRAAAALILRRGRDAGDEGMVLQEVGDGAAQLPGAVTVDNAPLPATRRSFTGARRRLPRTSTSACLP